MHALESSLRSFEVQAEEGYDAAAGVDCGGFVVADGLESQQFQEPIATMIVHEGVAGVRILLYIVWDEGALEGCRQLIGYPLLPFGHATIATYNRAGSVEEIVDIFRKRAAVVDASGTETVPGGEQESEPATHTEPDNANSSVAAGLPEEPTLRGLDVVEGRTLAGNHVADDLTNADEPTAFVVKVGRNCKEAGLGEPARLVAMVSAHAKDVVQNDDARDGDGGCGDS
jgi:hypothetical protein